MTDLANCPTCTPTPSSRPWGRCPVCADDQVTLLEIAVQLSLRGIATPPRYGDVEAWRQQVQLVLQHYPDRRSEVRLELWQRKLEQSP